MLTAKDLLYKALDYDGVWNGSKKMLNSAPSQLRNQQLEKLFAAFGISKKNAKAKSQFPFSTGESRNWTTVYARSGRAKSMDRLAYIKTLTNFNYFSSGEFISDFDKSRYLALLEKTVSEAKGIFPEHAEIINQDPISLTRLFRNIYAFRLDAFLRMKFSLAQQASKKFSLEDEYSHHLRKGFAERMNDNLREVDEFLVSFIDADNRTFRPDEIGYEEFDFETIDSDWRNQWHK